MDIEITENIMVYHYTTTPHTGSEAKILENEKGMLKMTRKGCASE